MSILAAQHIKARIKIKPFRRKTIKHGMSYGLSGAGYDVRLDLRPLGVRKVVMNKGDFALFSIMEWMHIPDDIVAFVHDKSSLARKGIAVQNTVGEPGWFGYLTIEVTAHGNEPVTLYHGQPIAQVIFHQTIEPTILPYRGKYQDQPAKPVESIYEHQNKHDSSSKNSSKRNDTRTDRKAISRRVGLKLAQLPGRRKGRGRKGI